MYNLDTLVTFGKYKDWNVEKILNQDPGYIIWLSTIKDVNPVILNLANKEKWRRKINDRARKREYFHGNYNNDREHDSAFASCFDWGSQ